MSQAQFSPPSGLINVTMEVPGSKSVANRALVCAMLAEGTSHIRGLPDGDDTEVVLKVLREMSVLTSLKEGCHIVGNPHAVLPGIVDSQLAGTSSRFLTAVAALSDTVTVIDGAEPLRSRPMRDLHDALVQLGAVVDPLGEPGHLPVSISGGGLTGGTITMKADVSSQFISALMLIAPYLSGGLIIELEGAQVSGSYISMTARVMTEFGVPVVITGRTIEVPEMRYQACRYVVEPDFSSAAFPIVAVLLRGGQVRIRDLGLAMHQGDSAILEVAQKMGATWSLEGDDIVVKCSSQAQVPLLSLAMADCSDLVPVVAVAMTQCVAKGSIHEVGFIRNKESDRLGDVASELVHIGAIVEVAEDGLIFEGCPEITGATLMTHHDHRLAMSFALLSLVEPSISIDSPEVVSKSWPSYFTDMADILGSLQIEK
jgi:3-phosphoshikimate 1-carboxyvinyltransferase